jgi:hypothetical protein
MLPGVYEFSWNPFHVIFVTFFMIAFATVAGFAVWAAVRARHDRKSGRAGELRWHETFSMLPAERRVCRHELGVAEHPRLCDNGFDCARCARHREFDPSPATNATSVHGLPVHPDEYYGRGHAALRVVEGNVVEVFPDAFAQLLLRECRLRPRATDGAHLALGDAAFHVETPGGPLRILSPVTGDVVGTEVRDRVPVVKIRLDRPLEEQRQLLHGSEAALWLERELRTVERAVTPLGQGTTLADGGAIRPDLVESLPDVDWDLLREDLLLDA